MNLKVRKNIPMPTDREHRNSGFADACRIMEVGDSVDLPFSHQLSYIYTAASKAGITVTIKRIPIGLNDALIRVWRKT